MEATIGRFRNNFAQHPLNFSFKVYNHINIYVCVYMYTHTHIYVYIYIYIYDIFHIFLSRPHDQFR